MESGTLAVASGVIGVGATSFLPKLEEFYTLYPSQPGREFLCRQQDKKKDVTHTSRPELECASFHQLSYSTSGTRCISGFALWMIGSRERSKLSGHTSLISGFAHFSCMWELHWCTCRVHGAASWCTAQRSGTRRRAGRRRRGAAFSWRQLDALIPRSIEYRMAPGAHTHKTDHKNARCAQ